MNARPARHLSVLGVEASPAGDPAFLRIGLSGVDVSLDEAAALLAALERGETVTLTWAPPAVDARRPDVDPRAATLDVLRHAIARLRASAAERDALAAARAAERGAPPVDVMQILARRQAARAGDPR